jgi:hypothetical protein
LTDSAKRAPHFRALTLLNRTAAVAMAGAGIWILARALTGAAGPGPPAFVGTFLLYGALIQACATADRTSDQDDLLLRGCRLLVVGPMPLSTIGGVELFVAWHALFNLEEPNLLAGLLAIPGILSFASVTAIDLPFRIRRTTPGERAKLSISEYVTKDLRSSTRLAVAIVWLFFALWLIAILQQSLFEPPPTDVANQALIAAVNALALVAVLMIGTVVGSAATFMWERSFPKAPQAVQRTLTTAETAFVAASEDAVVAYAERRHLDWFGLLYLCALFVAVCAGSLGLVAYGHLIAVAPLPEGDDGRVYLIHMPTGPASIGLIFLLWTWLFFPSLLLSRLSRSFSECMGWLDVGGTPEFGDSKDHVWLRRALTKAVRAGRLSPQTAIDPGRYLHDVNRAWGPYILYPGLVVAVITGALLHLDRRYYELVTESFIEVVDYWSGTKSRFGYGDVTRVAVGCWRDDRRAREGGRLDPFDHLRPSYLIYLPNDRAIDLFRERNLTANLAAFEIVDAKLSAKHVRVDAVFTAAEQACLEETVQSQPSSHARLRRLLRIGG